MIFSMTGFGSYNCNISSRYHVRIEIFSVNSKSININFKSPFISKELELQLREKIIEHVKRGSIDCSMYFEKINNTQDTFLFDKKLFAQYVHEIRLLGKEFQFASDILLPSFYRIPDIFVKDEFLQEEEKNNLLNAVKESIQNLLQYREQEGKKLKESLLQQIEIISVEVEKIAVLEAPRKKKIAENLNKEILAVMPDFDRNRFQQELIYYIEKIDIHEEITRTKIHCAYLKNFLNENKEAVKGKKIAFILQEISREINTLGVKSNDAEIQKIVVELKDVIEKMKEQSLNIL